MCKLFAIASKQLHLPNHLLSTPLDGFHKITSIDNGGLKFDRDEMEFSHPCFQKDHPFLLEHIKRKIANPKQPAAVAAAAAVVPSIDEKPPNIKPELVNKVMNEVKVMRTRQESLDTRFSAMKKENEALWREVAILRQKHAKQQQIVNKLIQFLVTLVQPTRGGGGINNMSGVKRRFQLMINDVPESAKSHKGNEDSGTVIRELTDDLFDQVDYDNYDDDTASPNVLSPAEEPSEQDSIAETVSSSNYKVESHSVVDHPETDDDEDLRMETVDFDDKINYIIDEMSPATNQPTVDTSPTQEWLENNVLSPQQIKQEELDDQMSIRTIHENFGRSSNPKRSKTDKLQGTSLLNRKITKPALRLKIANNINTRSSSRGGTSASPAAQAEPVPSRTSATSTKTNSSLRGKMIAGLSTPYPGKLIAHQSSIGKRTAAPSQKPPVAGVAKGYTNKSDFISTEMPSELFDSPTEGSSSTSNNVLPGSSVDVSPMLGELSSAGYNPTLSEDYTKKIFPSGASTSTNNNINGGKNMAVTMYNKGKMTTA